MLIISEHRETKSGYLAPIPTTNTHIYSVKIISKKLSFLDVNFSI